MTVLELRPLCEHCALPLPPQATDAMICTFECTFCCTCVEHVLRNVCPNCGGGFVPRPIRPARNWRGDNYLGAFPPSTERRHRPVDWREHVRFAAAVSEFAPHER